jgi:protein-disulfide isomerase
MLTAFRRLTLPLALTLAAPALAFDVEAMTDAERTAFRAEIRAYLLENPEVLMEAIGVLDQREQEAQANADVAMLSQLAPQIYEDGVSFVGGNPDGDVTVVEFFDYRCGFCKRAFNEVEELVETDGNIRIIFKEFPILGEASVMASQFAIAALQVHGDDAYKAIHDTLMTFDGDITLGSLTEVAETLGIDATPIVDHMGSPEVAAVISANYALAQQMAINGTPTFVMGDELVRGYVDLETMQALVEGMRQDG